MNIDLNKTLGYDAGKRTGIDALHTTMTSTPPEKLAEKIAEDMTAILNQAVNTLLANPAKPGATIPMAQLTGYLGELASVAGEMAAGCSFERIIQQTGEPSLMVNRPQPMTKRSTGIEAAAAGVNL